MKKKTGTAPKQNTPSHFILAEVSPRDFLWETFELTPGLTEVNHFGYIDTRAAIPLGEHCHPDTFEFVYIEKGKVSWDIGNLRYETKEGDLFYTRPDEFHRASNNILEPCRIWNFGMRTPYISEKGIEHNWMQQNSADITSIVDGMHKLPRVTFLGSTPLLALRRLVKAIQQPGEHSRLEGRNAVIDLILQLFQHSNAEKAEANNLHYKLEALINHLQFQWGDCPSVEAMAAKLGISVTYFYRLFHKHTGMTPRNYIERLRIKEACRLLTETKASITHISMDLGFATSQHFSSVFHRLAGRTPTQWRHNNDNIDSWFMTFRHENYDFIKVRES